MDGKLSPTEEMVLRHIADEPITSADEVVIEAMTQEQFRAIVERLVNLGLVEHVDG